MSRRTIWPAVLALIVVSCTDVSSDTDAEIPEESTETFDPGRLVLLNSSGDIVVMDPDGANREDITDDAGEAAIYTQPVWSPDAATLAWGQVSEDGFAVGILEPGATETTIVETSNLPFYMFWSPDGENLGVLHNGATGVDFRMVDVDQGTSITVDSAVPFYFSWSPDGDRVVTHAGEDRVETIRPDGGRLRLEPTSSTYLAPQWAANGVFHVVGDELVLEDDDGERTPIAVVSGLTMFVANPQGTRVALQTTGDNSALPVALSEPPTVPSGSVAVVDLESGMLDVAHEGLALGFFWSPDGGSLLMITPDSGGVLPRVWTVGGGATDYVGYQPPGTMLRDTFPFFPQYAQSVSFWSPDSEAFTFAGDIDGDRGIWVQDVSEPTPTKVSDGVWVAWSSP